MLFAAMTEGMRVHSGKGGGCDQRIQGLCGVIAYRVSFVWLWIWFNEQQKDRDR